MSNKRYKTDSDLIHSLQTLREKSGTYPPELLKKQRSAYLESVAGLAGFIPQVGLFHSLKNRLPKNGGKILLIILVIAALMILIGNAYVQQGEDTGWFLGEEISTNIGTGEEGNIPDSLMPETTATRVFISTPSATAGTRTSRMPTISTGDLHVPTTTSTLIIPIYTPTPTATNTSMRSSTPMPTATGTSNPNPTPTGNSTNPGNHYGQTKTPKP